MPDNDNKSIDGLTRVSTKKATAKKLTKAPAAKKPVAVKVAVKEATPAKAVVEKPVQKPKKVETPAVDDISAEIANLEQTDPGMTDIQPSAKKATKNHSLASKIICLVLLLAEVAAGGFFIYELLHINVLADWQNYAIIIVMALLFLFTARKLTKKKAKNVTRIVCCVLAVLLAIGYGIGTYYISTLSNFIEKITTVGNTETQEYSVVVYKDSSIKKINQLKGKAIGFQTSNIHLKLAESKLKESIKYEKKEYDDLASIFIDMDNGSLSAITMASSYLDVLKDDAKEYYDRLKVVFKYEIEFEKEKKTSKKVDTQNDPFVLYISGIDSRTGIKSTALSDVNMLAAINPKKNKILLISVPRDYYVQLHGTTGKKDKLTHAGIYGLDMSKNTMSDLFGDIEINHTIKVSFKTVENLVNAIDGIDIYSDKAFRAWTDYGCRIPKGDIHLDGRCALAFARERMTYATGDRHRVENQQNVFAAILKKVTSIQYIVNYPKLLSAIEGTFQTSLSYEEITGFAKMQMNTMKSWEIEQYSVNGSGGMQPTYSMGSQPLYVMIPDQSTVDEAIAKIKETLSTK
ncbi:LCP family protein [Candidatus Saccharibacteria bacterium]|nr:LCP family protein [Candidatus Saccharibacteria bacterium]